MWTERIAGLFASENFMPHGMCFLWDPALVWLHAISDFLIGAAYFSIPIALCVFAMRRRDLAYRWMVGLFTLFIVACGATHFFGIWTLWNPDYAVEGVLKAATAVTSLATAVLLWPILPKALALPSPSMLENANAELVWEIAARRAAEQRLQALNHELEERVAARTTELEDKNAELESEMARREAIERALVEQRDRAEVANQSKSQFLAMMSHELRTPLNAIMGFSEVIETEAFGPLGAERYRDYAHDIRTSGGHLLELINELLDLSKIEAGRMELTEEEVDLAEVMGAAHRLLRDKAASSGVTLKVDAPATMLLTADRRALKQALINLVSNAIKFTPEGGRVAVKAGLDVAGNPTITVTDDGIGMTEEELETAITAFGQADAGRRLGGTGLGLTLTAALAELHGGRIDIETERDAGTRVTIVLPAERLRTSRNERRAAD